MGRRRRLRKIVAPPDFLGYSPFGTSVTDNGSVDLLYEEYEAIKLADYDFMNHKEACKLMGVSRPTFARIYQSARRKIAAAFVESKTINAVYGNVYFEKNWFVCENCYCRFTIPIREEDDKCPLCNSKNVEPIIKKNDDDNNIDRR